MYVLLFKQESAQGIQVVYISPQVWLGGPVIPSWVMEDH